MSHFTTIRTELKDRGILLNTLEDLGLDFRIGGTLRTHGLGMEVDIAVKMHGAYRFGYRKAPSAERYEVTGVYSALNDPKVKKLLSGIQQGYAQRKTLMEARKRGFALVREQTTSGGAIKLVLRKVSQKVA
jgi:hypothetical protein